MSKPLLFAMILFLAFCHSNDKSEGKSAPASTSAPASADSAMQVDNALTFLNSYVDNCRNLKDAVDVIDWVNASPLASKHLKTGLKKLMDDAYKQDSIMGPDADPIFDAQSFPDKGFEYDSIDRASQYVFVKGKDWREFTLCVKMTKENDKWLVDGCGMVNIPEEKRRAK